MLETLTIGQSIAEAAHRLRSVSASPRLDAEILLGAIVHRHRHELIRDHCAMVDPAQWKEFEKLVERALEGEPIAYILGRKDFYSLTFEVNPSVLIPRPETELIVDLAIMRASRMLGMLKILDLGTGSGCIAVSLAHELGKLGREMLVVALDISAEALETARRNATAAGVEGHIDFRESDWFSGLKKGDETFDLILTNPPYIATGDEEISPCLRFEPAGALFSGPDGLSDIRHLTKEVQSYLTNRGVFLCEIGANQREAVEAHLCGEEPPMGFARIQIHKDLSSRDRVLDMSMQVY